MCHIFLGFILETLMFCYCYQEVLLRMFYKVHVDIILEFLSELFLLLLFSGSRSRSEGVRLPCINGFKFVRGCSLF